MAHVSDQHTERVMSLVNGDKSAVIDIADERIKRSWLRCLTDHSIVPQSRPDHFILERDQLMVRRESADELLKVAIPEMANLFQQIAGSGFCVLLSDHEGVVVESLFDSAIATQFMQAGLRLGANWSEMYEGTNGIGTCIATNEPITIHLKEHFNVRNVGLSCSGSPIMSPSGDLMGVLDVSSTSCIDSRKSQQHTLALVNMTAKMISNQVFINSHQGQLLLRFHSRRELVGILCEGLIALDDQGNIDAVNENAMQLLGIDKREEVLGKKTDEFFDLSLIKLIDHARRLPNSPVPMHDQRDSRLYYAALQFPKGKELFSSRLTSVRGKQSSNKRSLSGYLTLDDLANSDERMLRVVAQTKRIMNRHIPIILQGETGCGKEAFARAVHNDSDRAHKNFVAINCAAIPENLIESELFGYKGGAFTGARKEGMRGKILQANEGTLFLDEIGDMPLQLQTRLLRVLEEREVVALGSETAESVDFDLIVATHRDIGELVAHGEFREDLYYRLNGLTLHLPPLRERSDLKELLESVLELEKDSDEKLFYDPEALKVLLKYHWPGNVRELRNVIRVAVALREGHVIDLQSLPDNIVNPKTLRPDSSKSAPSDLAAPIGIGDSKLLSAERDALLEELEKCRWNVTCAAKSLGMSRATLYRKLKKHNIAVS